MTNSRPNLLGPIVTATALAGALDLALAIVLTLSRGKPVAGMLRFVASGPFPSATEMGMAGAALGVVVHFSLMAIMVATFVALTARRPALLERPILWGALYGFVTYVVLDLVVVPLRFGTPLPPPPISIVTQAFAHVVLVGILTASITKRALLHPDQGQRTI